MVWIVDDEVDIRDSVAALLVDAGFRARVFADGGSLLVALESDLPDAFILDDDMPVMSGTALRKHLLTVPRFAAIPAILFTASALAECPAALVVRKPAGIDLLVSVLRAACADAAKDRDTAPTLRRASTRR
jgi:FixJ family two-component response regulator